MSDSPVRNHIAKLPDSCFVVLPANQQGERVGVVRVGESGYTQVREPVRLHDADIKAVHQFVNEQNKEDGVTVEQRMAMEHGSMFGWETAGADPDHKMNKALAAQQRALDCIRQRVPMPERSRDALPRENQLRRSRKL